MTRPSTGPLRSAIREPYYRTVFVLHMFWRPTKTLHVTDRDFLHYMWKECKEFSNLLKGPKFNYVTRCYQIPWEGYRQDFIQENVENELIREASACDLFILHYGGHGTSDRKWILSSRNPNLAYLHTSSLIQAVSSQAKGDVLIISDSCESGNLTGQSRAAINSVEILSATPPLGSTPARSEDHIFTFTRMIRETFESWIEGGPFATSHVAKELVDQQAARGSTTFASFNPISGRDKIIVLPKLSENLPRDGRPDNREICWFLEEDYPLSFIELDEESKPVQLAQSLAQQYPHHREDFENVTLDIRQLEFSLKEESPLDRLAADLLPIANQQVMGTPAGSGIRRPIELVQLENLRHLLFHKVRNSAKANRRNRTAQLSELPFTSVRTRLETDEKTAEHIHAAEHSGEYFENQLQVDLGMARHRSLRRISGDRKGEIQNFSVLKARWIYDASEKPVKIDMLLDGQSSSQWDLFIDWRSPPTSKEQGIREHVKSRVSFLASTLSTISENSRPEYCVLNCAGFIHLSNPELFGLVFERKSAPHKGDEYYCLAKLFPSGNAKSLKLNDPSRYERADLALALARAVAAFHAVGWVIKELQCRNVFIFVGNDENDRFYLDYSAPRLMGLAYARPGEDKSTMQPYYREKSNLWKHPERWHKPLVNQTRQHDYYSLGVLLVEIAEWQSSSKYTDGRQGGWEFKSRLETICTDNVSKNMGQDYGQAASSCLSAVEKGLSLVGKDTDSEECFQHKVVDKLIDSCRKLKP